MNLHECCHIQHRYRPNLATYIICFYQGRYVQGVIAGKLSKACLACYVVSVLVPEVVQGMDAFCLGYRDLTQRRN